MTNLLEPLLVIKRSSKYEALLEARSEQSDFEVRKKLVSKKAVLEAGKKLGSRRSALQNKNNF